MWQIGVNMVLKIAIPGKMQFKMMRREPYLLHRKGDVHYIGGAEVLPPPLPSEQENQVIGDLGTDEDVIYRGIENEVERKLLMNAVSKLSKREKTIVRLRFGLGTVDGQEMTQKEVANLLGISQSYISRLEKKIMRQLKKEISLHI